MTLPDSSSSGNSGDIEQANRDFFAALARQGQDEMNQQQSLNLSIGNLYDSMTAWNSAIAYRMEAQATRFRGSDLPFCPRKYMLDQVRDRPRYEEVKYMSDFYTTGGDAFHTTLQRWLGISGKLWGKFKCRKCGKLYPEGCTEDDNKGMFGPVKCCHEPAYYHELHVTGKHFSGHLDGLTYFQGKFLASEFKQMGSKKFEKRLSSGYDNHHYYQIQTYRRLLPEWLGWDESMFHPYVLLWYFDRGDCRINKRWLLKYEPSVYDDQAKLVSKTTRNIRDGRYLACGEICKSSTDNTFCPYNQMVCFAPLEQKNKMLDALIGDGHGNNSGGRQHG